MSGTTYNPQAGASVGAPPCANCGAARRLHRPAAGARYWWCPEPYRPESIDVARRELAEAEASEDAARVFVARGNLQRLMRAQAPQASGEPMGGWEPRS